MNYTDFLGAILLLLLMNSCSQQVISAPNNTVTNIHYDLITPQQFGAKGDGKADDSASLQQAINYCVANNRKLFVPSGTYRTVTTLKISGTLVIEGETKTSAYIWYDPTGSESLLTIDGERETKDLRISNLKFGLRSFGKNKNNVHCILVKNSLISRLNISNVEFFGFTGYGLYLTGKDTYGQNLAFRDLSFYRMGGVIGQNNDRGISNWWTNLVVLDNIHLDAYSGHSINLQSPQPYIVDLRGWRMLNIRNLLVEGAIQAPANIKASLRLGGGYTEEGSHYLGLGNVTVQGFWEEWSSKSKPEYSVEFVDGVSVVSMEDVKAQKFLVTANSMAVNISGLRMHGLNIADRFKLKGDAKVYLSNVYNSSEGITAKKFSSVPNVQILSVIEKH